MLKNGSIATTETQEMAPLLGPTTTSHAVPKRNATAFAAAAVAFDPFLLGKAQQLGLSKQKSKGYGCVHGGTFPPSRNLSVTSKKAFRGRQICGCRIRMNAWQADFGATNPRIPSFGRRWFQQTDLTSLKTLPRVVAIHLGSQTLPRGPCHAILGYRQIH